jgi:hypothetical protein
MDKGQAEARAARLIQAVRMYVGKAIEPVTKKLAELELAIRSLPAASQGQKGERGDPGPKGDSQPAVDVEQLLAKLVLEAKRLVDEIPRPKDGERGERGHGPDPEQLRGIVAAEVDRAVAAMPAPLEGQRGEPGEKGERGPGADEAAILERLMTALRAEVEKLPKPKDGEKGERGDSGVSVDMAMLKSHVASWVKDAVEILKPKDGKDGAPGQDGKPASHESVALLVAETVEKALAKLPRAQDGDDGRDAAQIEPLPEIDSKRSYPRGTFADYRNGMVRALRQTDPLEGLTLERAGWAVCMNGIAPLAIESADGGRTIRIVSKYTNGAEVVHELKTDILKYRNVWTPGAYERGDIVTWNGSSWHCERATQSEPETSDDWKLMVKRGRDGFRPPKEVRKAAPVALR